MEVIQLGNTYALKDPADDPMKMHNRSNDKNIETSNWADKPVHNDSDKKKKTRRAKTIFPRFIFALIQSAVHFLGIGITLRESILASFFDIL